MKASALSSAFGEILASKQRKEGSTMAHRLALIGQDDAGGLEAGGEENLEN